MSGERKVVLVTRRTRLEELVARYHTLAQARFYIEHLGADFGDYLRESAAYAAAHGLTFAGDEPAPRTAPSSACDTPVSTRK